MLEPRTPSGLALRIEQLPVLRALAGESPDSVDMHVTLANGPLLLTMSARPVLDKRGRVLGALLWSRTR